MNPQRHPGKPFLACTLMALLLTAVFSPAASANNLKAGPLTLRALALRPLVERELWLKHGEAFVPLAISCNQPSEVQQADFTIPLPIFRGPLDAKGKPSLMKPVPVTIPAAATNVLLLAWPGPDGTEFFAVPDDFKSGGPADWLLVNTSRHPIAFQIGNESKPVRLEPAKQIIHTVKSASGEGAAVKVAMPGEGNQWKLIYSTYWPIDPQKRSIVLLVDDGRKIRVKLILDAGQSPDPQ